jgi:glycosyltransferase involved in cell wall biosynthesis
MISVNRAEDTWNKRITRIIALTDFAKSVFVRSGINADLISVKPNFARSPPTPPKVDGREHFALFVGRLSEEKGIRTLFEAWRTVQSLPLVVAGDGPLMGWCVQQQVPNITLLGRQSEGAIQQLMLKAKLLAMPSLWYEGFPMVIAEAFAAGLPVVASKLGSPAEIVGSAKGGWLFEVGNRANLAEVIDGIVCNESDRVIAANNARDAYERLYSPNANYKALLDIYLQAKAHNSARPCIENLAVKPV